MRLLPVVCTLLVIAAAPAAAQDPVRVASANYTVLAENARVRVLRATLPPGSQAAMHEHPAHLAVSLTDGTVQMTLADGKTIDTETKAEEVMLMPAGKHATANHAKAPVDVIVIEMKAAPGTATLPSSRPGMKMTTLLEDARVMAHRVAFDPSFSEPDGTTHEYDQVVIPLAASDIALTMGGKTMSTWKRGEVTLIGRGEPHGSKAGKQASDMIVVTIK
jgi:quercetin dioxygenase-like cupin family protein